MPVRIDLSSNASVRLLSVNDENTACAYLANLYIPIFSLDSGKVIRRYEVPNQIAGIHFSFNKKSVIYAVDDSFGLHTFDFRTDSKKKHRMNPESENHNVVCTALSSNSTTIAVASSEFGGGILDVRGSRRREHHHHVVSLYDLRYPNDPITSYFKRLKSSVTSMEFYLNGNDLILGDESGSIKSFDCQLRDEDNAVRWERWATGPISKVGVINKRIVYGISRQSQASVFVDSKGKLEVLYGSVTESADDPVVGTSKAYYKDPEWCIGLIKGVNDDIPLVGVHGVKKKKIISMTAMNQDGVRQEKPMLSYKGHKGEVKCMAATKDLLLTGGEDGKVIVQIANFKNPKFGDDNINHHRLTLNRGNLAELKDKGLEKDDEAISESDDSESDDGSKPSTSASASVSSSSKHKKDKHDIPSTSSAASTSSSSSSKHETKEERKARKEKERERAEKKAKKEKDGHREEEKPKKKDKKHETEEERAERKRKEKKEKERQERKEKEHDEQKKRHRDNEEGAGSSSKRSKAP
ncbi:WD repeat-containing protein 89 [Caenorhabditis elegans]|uniref:WD repeat-containing protein 89 n=1 Tax=Caenorhabditis elegans TaxID=6239 RepID=Q22540_CAEEL|nr:WD repeat-containing protein 89 [Caenorhabditis elegans]CAA92191.1 WD repeat-containing protein 89 [Caenorhabditis elegans]|eukprot:NP_510088.1 Uncharacterized protein CELE_T18D3.1 [Caenorhabditis elegans]